MRERKGGGGEGGGGVVRKNAAWWTPWLHDASFPSLVLLASFGALTQRKYMAVLEDKHTACLKESGAFRSQ